MEYPWKGNETPEVDLLISAQQVGSSSPSAPTLVIQLRAALTELDANLPWIDVHRLAAEVIDADMHTFVARRNYPNQLTNADDVWTAADRWHVYLDCAKP